MHILKLCTNGNLYMYHSETIFSIQYFVRLIHVDTCSSSSFIFLVVESSRVCVFTYPFSWRRTFISFPCFRCYKWGCSENSWAYIQISLNVHLEVIFVSSTWLDIAKLPCKVLALSPAMPGSFHCFTSSPEVVIWCAFKTFASLMDKKWFLM